MNEYKIIFTILFLYGCYNLVSLYQQRILTKLNVSFYIFVLVVSIYGFFFIGSPSKQPKKQTSQFSTKPNQQKERNQENRAEIIPIPKEKHEEILKKLQFDIHQPSNKMYRLENLYKIKNKYVQQRFKEHQKLRMEKIKLEGQCGPAYTNFGYHGTKKTCVGFEKACSDRQNCPFCNILVNGFRNAFSGKGLSYALRYGKGTYFSPKISKALVYCQSDEKIIFGCKLVMGKVFKPQNLEQYYMYFDGGQFDCIDADPEYTTDIREPEICMKNEKACLPKYILVFKSS